jgi:hypothetical protein
MMFAGWTKVKQLALPDESQSEGIDAFAHPSGDTHTGICPPFEQFGLRQPAEDNFQQCSSSDPREKEPGTRLSSLVQQNCKISDVEVNEMLRLCGSLSYCNTSKGK